MRHAEIECRLLATPDGINLLFALSQLGHLNSPLLFDYCLITRLCRQARLAGAGERSGLAEDRPPPAPPAH